MRLFGASAVSGCVVGPPPNLSRITPGTAGVVCAFLFNVRQRIFSIFSAVSAVVSEAPQQPSKARQPRVQQPRFKLFPLWQPRAVLLRVCSERSCVYVCCHFGLLPGTAVGTRISLKKRGVIQLLLLLFIFAITTSIMLSAAAVYLLHFTVSFWPCGNLGTTAVVVAVLQALLLVTATYERCLCACGRAYYVACHVHSEGRFQPHTTSEFKKKASAQNDTAAVHQQQQRHNTSERRKAHILLYTGTRVSYRIGWSDKSVITSGKRVTRLPISIRLPITSYR